MNNKKPKSKKRKRITVALVTLGIATFVSIGISFPLVSNLKKEAQIKISKNNIFKDKNNFINFDQKIPTKQLALPDGKINPSQLSALTNHAKIPKSINGIKREFTIKTDIKSGIAIVTITFYSEHGHVEITTYKIKNFKTNLDLVNEKIQKLNISDIKNRPLKKKDIIIEYNSKPSQNHIKDPTHNELNFKFVSTTPVDANGNSRVTYQVDVDPQVVGTESKQLTFEVNGFQTQLAYAQSQLDTLTKNDISRPTKKNLVSYENRPTVGDLNPPQASGFSFAFVSTTPVNTNGDSRVTYQVDVDPQVVGTESKQLTFEVNGFQTQLAYAQSQLDTLTKNDISRPTKKEEVGYKSVPTTSDLNPPQASGFSFAFVSATPVNTNGDSRVTYQVDVDPQVVGTESKQLTFEVNGFQTQLAYAQSQLDTLTKNDISRPTKKNLVSYENRPTVGDLNPPQASGFSFAFVSATPVNTNGDSRVTYQVDVDPQVVGTESKQLTFEVNGFQTQLAYAQSQLDTLTKNDISRPTKKILVSYENRPTVGDLNPPQVSGFSFAFVSATPVNTNGDSRVTYQVDVDPQVVGTESKQLTFEVNGFQTQLAYAQSQLDTLTKNDISRPTKKNLVSYENRPTVGDLNPPQASGFSFAFVSATPVNTNGDSRVTYQVDVDPQVVGTSYKKFYFDVSIMIPPTKKNLVHFRNTPTIKDLNAPQAYGFNFKFINVTPVDANGKVRVHYKTKIQLELGFLTKTSVFEVGGFQTKKEYFDSLVTRIKKDFGTTFGGRIVDPKLINSTPEQVIQNIKDIPSFKRYTTRDWFDIIENPNDIEIKVIKSSSTSIVIFIKIKERPNNIFKYVLYQLKAS